MRNTTITCTWLSDIQHACGHQHCLHPVRQQTLCTSCPALQVKCSYTTPNEASGYQVELFKAIAANVSWLNSSTTPWYFSCLKTSAPTIWMSVNPLHSNYSNGTRTFSFEALLLLLCLGCSAVPQHPLQSDVIMSHTVHYVVDAKPRLHCPV